MTKKNAFGIAWEPPDRDTAVSQYLNRCAYKVRLAIYHLAEFERLEAKLTGADFFDFEGAPFAPRLPTPPWEQSRLEAGRSPGSNARGSIMAR